MIVWSVNKKIKSNKELIEYKKNVVVVVVVEVKALQSSNNNTWKNDNWNIRKKGKKNSYILFLIFILMLFIYSTLAQAETFIL